MMAGGKWRLLGVRACVGKAMLSCVVVGRVGRAVGMVMPRIGFKLRIVVCGCDRAFVMLCE